MVNNSNENEEYEFKYGCIRDEYDPRDFKFKASPSVDISQLPTHVDLRDKMPEIYHQKNTASCTAQAFCAILYCMHNCTDKCKLSRLFQYYNSRIKNNLCNYDRGSTMRDTIKAFDEYGHVRESLWDFDISKINTKPPEEIYTKAFTCKTLGIEYHNIDRPNPMLRYALSQGKPIMFCTSIFPTFEHAKRKPYIIDVGPTQRILGGHAMVIVGYDNEKKLFTVRNSYGVEWGDNGHCYMSYNHMYSSMCYDFWVIDTLPEHIDLKAKQLTDNTIDKK